MDLKHPAPPPITISPALMIATGSGRGWTEERHVSFLNRIEESFVRAMLGWGDENDHQRLRCASASSSWCRRPRLDRYVPDSATESTLDSWSSPTLLAKLPAAGDSGNAGSGIGSHESSGKRHQDQVVPQVGAAEVRGETGVPSGDSPAKKKKRSRGRLSHRS